VEDIGGVRNKAKKRKRVESWSRTKKIAMLRKER
jgi:hypothetical protein